MRRRFLLVLLLITISAVTIRLAAPRLVDWIRRRAEDALATAFHTTASIANLELSLAPLRLRIGGVNVGGDAPALRIGAADLRVDVVDSLRRGSLAGQLSAHDVFLNIDRLPKPSPAKVTTRDQHEQPPILPVEITATELTAVAVQFFIDHEAVTATAPRATGRVGLSRERPYLTFSVLSGEAALQRADRRLSVATVDLAAGVRADQFFVDHWTIQGDRLSVNATGEALPPAAKHHIVADLPFEALAVIFEPLEELTGALHVDGTCHGELFDPIAEADVRLSGTSILGEPVGDVHGTLTRRGRDLALSNVDVAAWGGSAGANLRMTVGGVTPVKGEVEWKQIDAPLIGHLDRPAHRWSVLSSGTGELTGQLEPLELNIRAAGSIDPRVAESSAQSARWSAELDITQPQPHVKPTLRLNGTIEQGPSNRARVALALDGAQQLSGQVETQLGDAAKLAPLTPSPLRDGLAGSVGFVATVSGPMARPTVAGSATADRLTIFGSTIQRLRGDVEWTGAALTTRAVEVTTATGSAAIDGTVALVGSADNDWQVTARNFDLSTLAAAAEFLNFPALFQGGTLDGAASGRGPWAALRLDADLHARGFWLLGEPVHALQLRAHAKGGRWDGELQLEHSKSDSLRLVADGQGTSDVHATLESSPWQLAHLRGAGFRGLDGTVTLRATVNGPLDRLSGSAQIDGQALTLGGHAWGAAAIAAQGTDGRWTADATLLGESLKLHGRWQLGNGYPFSLAGELARTDIASLLFVKSLLHIDAGGSFHVSGRLSALGEIAGDVRITPLTIVRQSAMVEAREPIVLRGERGRFTVVSCTIAGTGGRIGVAGSLSTSGILDVTVDSGGDLELAELLVSSVQSARGAFNVTARMQRSEAGQWSVAGAARLEDGDLDLGLPIAFTKTDAALSLSGSRIVIDNLAGKAGGGTFRVGGAADLNAGPELSWNLHEVGTPIAEGLEARISGSGTVAGDWGTPIITGDVEVLSALYDRTLALGDFVPWLQRYLLPTPTRTEAAARPIALDLRIYAHDGVYIDNNVAKVEMWLNLQATGTTAKPVVTGTIGFVSGEVIYQDRTFTVTGGSIDFRDALAINPVLNITAESNVTTVEAEYTVRVVVSGTADNPRVQFGADDPSLSQNDVLSLVAFGKTAAQLQREGSKVSPGTALTLLPTSPVEQQVRRFAGLDRFEIDATQAQDSGTIEPRITVGKDLTEQIRALASSSFGVNAQRTVQLEYRFTPRFSLLGSWESDSSSNAGAFGGGMKFRYEFRRLPVSLRAPREALVVPRDAQ
ncbi:MAG TPA: translocation/assembly module TamB domain-containing protein [Candidatus Binatia bacterium]|nr:translocation/assembly module TamB domain-containing protein [Candidatus Binatia bacterium]